MKKFLKIFLIVFCSTMLTAGVVRGAVLYQSFGEWTFEDLDEDRLPYYDNTTDTFGSLQIGSGLTITGGALEASGGGGAVNSVSGTTNRISIGGTSTDPIVDISTSYVGQNTITTLGTIATGTWQGGVVAGQYGGTGVANTGKTITLGNNLTTSGNFALTLTQTGTTNVTLPTTGTLATLAGVETFNNKTLDEPKLVNDGFFKDTNNNEYLTFKLVASAVNYLTVTNSATGNAAKLSAGGDDTNINLELLPKGSGRVTSGGVNIPTISSTDTLTNKSIVATQLTGTLQAAQFPALTGDVTTSAGSLATTIGADKILESMLKVVDSPADEECLTYEATGGDFEWQACAGGVAGVSSITGTANQVLANGNSGTSETGAVTLTLPQDIATSSTPQFAKLGIGAAASATRLLYVTGDVTGGVATIERANATTNAAVGIALLKAKSSGAMADGYGAVLTFAHQDTDAVENLVATIRSVRNGADDSADLYFGTANAGTITNTMKIDKYGFVTFTPTAATALTAGTEFSDVTYATNRTVTWTGGSTIALNRSVAYFGPTYAATSSTTMTEAIGYLVNTAPRAGTNMTITSTFGFVIGNGLGSVANGGSVGTSWGFISNTQTGATNNYNSAFVSAANSGGIILTDSIANTPVVGGGLTIKPAASTTGSPTMLSITAPAHTTLTASTEAPDIDFNFGRTVQFATGALTNQRAVKITAPTYAFVGASTLTNASTFYINDAPTAGTNATLTNKYAMFIDAGTSRFDGLFDAGGTPLTANQIWGANNAGTAMEGKTISTGTTAVSNDIGVTLSTANSIIIQIPDASATVRGAVTTGTQTLAGAKTVTSTFTASGAQIQNIRNSLGTTITAGTIVANTTSATGGAPVQVSPYFGWSATGYTGSASQNATFYSYAKPVNGTNPITANLIFGSNINAAGNNDKIYMSDTGYWGIGQIPTAVLHLKAGTATANTAPFKFTSGTKLTTAEAGAMEYDGTSLFFTNGGAQRQELFQGQQGRVSSQFDKTNTTLADVTGLTATLVAGKIYRFEATLFVDANVTGGSKYAIGGTATATAITYHIDLTCDATNTLSITSRQTAIAGSAGQAGCTAGMAKITGTITVNAAGTLTVQFAQNTATGTSSVLVGSTFVVTQMP